MQVLKHYGFTGDVTMSLKSGGMQDDYFAANFENRLIFREVIDVSA